MWTLRRGWHKEARKAGKGVRRMGWEGEMRNGEWCAFTEMSPRQMGFHLLPNSLWSDVMSKTEERAVGQENPSATFPQVVSWFLMFWMAFKKKKSNIFTDYVLTNKQTITQSHCSLQSSTSHLWNSNVVSQRLVVTKMDKFLKQLAAFNEKQK